MGVGRSGKAKGQGSQKQTPVSSALTHTVLSVRGRVQTRVSAVMTVPVQALSTFCILTHSTLTTTLWDMMTTVVVVIILNCGCYYYD